MVPAFMLSAFPPVVFYILFTLGRAADVFGDAVSRQDGHVWIDQHMQAGIETMTDPSGTDGVDPFH